MGNVWSQAIWIPHPTLTEKNAPDQTGRVHVVTGGYTGCGLDLAKILYAHNAHVFIAGRSPQKYADAEKEVLANAPNSKGSCSFVKIDFADLRTIKPAADDLLSRADRIDVLTQNAGVMMPPLTEKTAQGEDLQLGTNCLGSWLFYVLLRPRLVETAKRNDVKPGETRVTWAGSMAVEILSPKPSGTVMVPDEKGGHRPKVLNDKFANYGQSKVGNVYMAVEGAKKDAKDGLVHVAWNPGNLKTPLYRHNGTIANFFTNPTLYAPIMGAYTELYAAVSPDITPANSGCYVWPWGRIGGLRTDVARALKTTSEGGTGEAEKFVAWCERETAPYSGIVQVQTKL